MERKNVFITGASRGIGRSTACCFARNGWDVIGTYLKSEREILDVKNECVKYGANFEILQMDCSDYESISSAISSIKKFDNLSALVNNAGSIIRSSSIGGINTEIWKKTLDVNLTGVYLITEILKAHLINGKGTIVNVGSTVSFRGAPAILAYSTAKAGVIAMTRSYAKEFEHHVRVNCVLPGFIDTDMTSSSGTSFVDEQVSRTILKRLGKPNEVAEAIYFLASNKSSYITGQSIIVDGGHWIN